MLANGTWEGQIKDGDYIQLTTTDGYTYKMYFNINTYQYGSNGRSYEAPSIDMIADYLLPTTSKLRETGNNNGDSNNKNPFMASSTIITFLKNYLNNIPATLKSHIVNKAIMAPIRFTAGVTNLTDENGYANITLPKLWIPFAAEVQGGVGTNNSVSYYNSTYELYLRQYHHFKNPLNRIKKINGNSSARDWWLASARVKYVDYFCGVDSSGNLNYSSANFANGVPLCFRFR